MSSMESCSMLDLVAGKDSIRRIQQGRHGVLGWIPWSARYAEWIRRIGNWSNAFSCEVLALICRISFAGYGILERDDLTVLIYEKKISDINSLIKLLELEPKVVASSPLLLARWVIFVFRDRRGDLLILRNGDLLILGNGNRSGVGVRLEMWEWELSGREMSEFARVEEAIDGWMEIINVRVYGLLPTWNWMAAMVTRGLELLDSIRTSLAKTVKPRLLDKEPQDQFSLGDDLVSNHKTYTSPFKNLFTMENEIITFYQKPNEAFNEAWERFKGLLRQCPHHGFSELHQLDTFYNSLNSNDQDALDSAAGGNFLGQNASEV
ncbi:reverse transcriptase domain-containing protein [Tanacetum coccineum]